MPTGFTSGIYDGNDSLRDYLLEIARGMGFAFHLRDSPDHPIEPVEVDGYAIHRLERSKEELVKAQALTVEEATELANRRYDELEKDRVVSLEKYRQIQTRYDQMIEKVQDWHPDPCLNEMRDFALQQLKESRKFDDMTDYYAKPAKRLTGEEYIERELDIAERGVKYAQEAYDEAVQRAEEKNAHIKALYDSLPSN